MKRKSDSPISDIENDKNIETVKKAAFNNEDVIGKQTASVQTDTLPSNSAKNNEGAVAAFSFHSSVYRVAITSVH